MMKDSRRARRFSIPEIVDSPFKNLCISGLAPRLSLSLSLSVSLSPTPSRLSLSPSFSLSASHAIAHHTRVPVSHCSISHFGSVPVTPPRITHWELYHTSVALQSRLHGASHVGITRWYHTLVPHVGITHWHPPLVPVALQSIAFYISTYIRTNIHTHVHTYIPR